MKNNIAPVKNSLDAIEAANADIERVSLLIELIGMAMTEITPAMAEKYPLKYSHSSIGDALQVLSRTLSGIHDNIEDARADAYATCMERDKCSISA